MTVQALGTPTVYFPDPTFTTLAMPTGTAYTGGGLTFVNSPAALVSLMVLTQTGAVTVTVAAQSGHTTGVNAVSLGTAVKYYLVGPFDPTVYSDASGLVHVTFGTDANVNTVLAVILPASMQQLTMRATHCPMETVVGSGDW